MQDIYGSWANNRKTLDICTLIFYFHCYIYMHVTKFHYPHIALLSRYKIRDSEWLVHFFPYQQKTRNHLLYFARFCAGWNDKIANKNRQQRTLPGFLSISLYWLWAELYFKSDSQAKQVEYDSYLCDTSPPFKWSSLLKLCTNLTTSSTLIIPHRPSDAMTRNLSIPGLILYTRTSGTGETMNSLL